ncbi:hypothetical protein RM863_04090 [Streptomyces sp. DSM 41014]|uniref:Integral membrane protein n=1 Tax=Streptomyces hintoniae TaxID=3075521 RepID=A0ABU2UDR7_9ACTN|nr:hypothetical protein [Streptomyces sp. DSM 41014]MDT0471313.1 hypothetical protein [Streptomyces sp. DSM 41014]
MRAVRAVLRHQARLFGSLPPWVRARQPASGGAEFGYAKGQGPMLFGFAFAGLVETVTMAVLLRHHPVAHLVMLVLDVYGVLFVVALHAASVVRPHLLDGGTLRVRRAAQPELPVPLADIASVRQELRATHTRADGELDLVVGAQTSVTLELVRPVPYFTSVGRRQEVRLVRFHADDAGAVVRAVERARGALSPLPSDPVG